MSSGLSSPMSNNKDDGALTTENYFNPMALELDI
jgi:hypothetical protein